MPSLTPPTIGLLNGPNLDRLGQREPQIYGYTTLDSIETSLRAKAQKAGYQFKSFQSNHEGALIDTLWTWHDDGVKGVILNPVGLCHTSISLHDAIAGINIPVIEVHLSNIYEREEFRRKSLTALACKECITGFGAVGYDMALEALLKLLPVT